MESPSKKSGDVGGDAFSGVFQKESWGLLPLLTPPPLALFFSSSGKEPSDEVEVYRSVFGGKSRLLFAGGAFIGPAGVFRDLLRTQLSLRVGVTSSAAMSAASAASRLRHRMKPLAGGQVGGDLGDFGTSLERSLRWR